MRIVKASAKAQKKSAVRPNSRPIRAAEDAELEAEAVVDPAATDMLFEAADVAELVSEVTGEDVTVAVDDEEDAVIFTVGEEEFTVTPEGDEEILEASRKSLRGKAPVRASRNIRKPAKNLRRR